MTTCTFDRIKSTVKVLGYTDKRLACPDIIISVTFLEVENAYLTWWFFLQGPGGNSLRGTSVLFMSSTHPQGKSLPWGVGSVGMPTLSD